MSRRQGPDGDTVDTRGPRSSTFVYSAPVRSAADSDFAWGNVDQHFLQRAVDAVTGRGHSISFAVNYRRTAGTITILAGSERPKWTDLTEEQALEVLKTLI